MEVQLSEQTRGHLDAAIKIVAQARAKYEVAYKSALRDGFGDGWEKTWQTREDRFIIIVAVESAVKKYLLEKGVSRSVVTKYNAMTQRCVLYGLKVSMSGYFDAEQIEGLKAATDHIEDPAERDAAVKAGLDALKKKNDAKKRQDRGPWIEDTVLSGYIDGTDPIAYRREMLTRILDFMTANAQIGEDSTLWTWRAIQSQIAASIADCKLSA